MLIIQSLCRSGLAEKILTEPQCGVSRIIAVHVASYAEEASWESLTNTQGDPLM